MELVKSIKKNTVILLFITVLVLFLVLKDDLDSIIKALKTMDYKFILIAVLLYLLSISLKAYVNYLTVNDKKKISLKEAIKHNIITQFFNGITPFSTGGQPMEVYMLKEHGIKVSHGTNIIIQNFIFYQTALVIYGIIAVLYNSIFHIFPKIPFLRTLVLIGFVINVIVAIALFVICTSEKFTKKSMHFLVRILAKLRIIKDKKATIVKWQEKLDEFHISAKELRKRKKLFCIGVFFNILSLTCLYIIPLFVVYAMHDYTSLSIMDCLTSSAYILIVGAFVPIPGASGGIEYGFLKFFGNFIGGSTIAAALLVWRFITYYFGMIIGALVFSLEKKVN